MAKANTMDRNMLEAALLGIIANYTYLADRIIFSEDYFTNPVHKKIYRYLVNIKYIDHMEMLEYMSADEINYFITSIYSRNIYNKDVEKVAIGFAKSILENYRRDRIISLSKDLTEGKILSRDYIQRLNRLDELSVEPKIEALTSEGIDTSIQNIREIEIKKFPFLSAYLKLDLCDFVTIAGKTGFGKSALMMNLFLDLAQSGNNCIYFDLEIGEKKFTKRLLSIASGEDLDFFTKENMSSETYNKARETLSALELKINHKFVNLKDLKSMIIGSIVEDKVNIVFIDHIGLIGTEGNDNEYDRISQCVRELRRLALDYNLIMFISSQVDRASIKAKSQGITINSLKSSGEIENSSSHVMLLKESEYPHSKDDNIKSEIMIDLCKNRSGEKAQLDYYTFDKRTRIFVEKIRDQI